MMESSRTTSAVLLLLILCLLIPAPLSAGGPTDQIRDAVEKAIAIIQDPELKTKRKREERLNRLRKAIYPRFDFAEMAKRALGFQWRRLTSSERKEFIHIFTDLLEQSYIRYIDSYNEEKFIFLREKLDGRYAEVRTRILTRKGEEFSVNYKTHLVNGEWKIYDIVAENISMVNNYRSQFKRVLSKSSYEELVSRINKKRSELLNNYKK
ncbi:MAG: phospholipid-binding protein MlaC [Candidatus Binatia bacterium]